MAAASGDVTTDAVSTPAEPAAPGVAPPPSWAAALLPRRDRRTLAVTAAVVLGAVAALLAAAPTVAARPALAALAVLAGLVSVGDAVTGRIPNKLNALGFALSWPLLAVAALGGGSGSLARAAAGSAAALALYGASWLIAPAGMGLGDVKWSPTIGAHLAFWSWDCWMWGVLGGFVAQAVIVLVGLALRRVGRRSHVPHGPAMCIGTIASLVLTLRGV
jgi:leader peptidase (prepilin peptidase) / N-methyltransferase